jgi:HK97 family phage portal protein
MADLPVRAADDTTPSRFRRLLAFFRIGRPVSVVEEEDHIAGADFAPNLSASSRYPVEKAMSAHAAFPWNFAAVSAVATDWAGLPWKLTLGDPDDPAAVRITDHPLLTLLQRPSSRVLGVELWRQIVVDLKNAGEAYLLEVGAPGQPPTSLLRLHPERTDPVAGADGQPIGYDYDNGRAFYAWEQVRHIKLSSWSSGPENLHGTGGIEPLNNALTASLNAQKSAAQTASTNRPSGILMATDKSSQMDSAQVKTVRRAYTKQLDGGSGLLIIGNPGLKYVETGWSPRDTEFIAQEEMTRDQILAVHDVTPTRVGIPNANYATDQAQSERYWNGIKGLDQLICAHLTLIAQKFDPDLVLCRDFKGVKELQGGRTQAIQNVTAWHSMGVPLATAAAYEGFGDLDLSGVSADADAPSTAASGTSSADGDGEARLLSAVLRLAAEPGYHWVHPVLRTLDAERDGADLTLLSSAATWFVWESVERFTAGLDLPEDPLVDLMAPHLDAVLEQGGTAHTRAQRLALLLREAWAGSQAPTLTREAALAAARWRVVVAAGSLRQRALIRASWEEQAHTDFWADPPRLEIA